ncbi:MAG: hypothetical protein ACK5WZ_05725, partial [Pseudobdellovibrionaceae bacterium]
SALGEVVKSGFLKPSLFKKIESLEILEFEDFFKLVPSCIEIKNFYLKKDPFEINGDRFFLNLGHTVGHGLEAHFRLNHGMAVLCGLEFMLRWSIQKKYIQKKTVLKLIPKNLVTVLRNALKQQKISYFKMINDRKFMEYILADKKRDKKNHIKEVFIFEKECRIVLIPIGEFEVERQRQTKEGDFGSLLF